MYITEKRAPKPLLFKDAFQYQHPGFGLNFFEKEETKNLRTEFFSSVPQNGRVVALRSCEDRRNFCKVQRGTQAL